MTLPSIRPRRAGILLVANYESDVGYAWWLMERFWSQIAAAAADTGQPCILAYPTVRSVPELIATAPIEIHEFKFSHASWSFVWSGVRFLRRHAIVAVYLTDWPYFHPAYLLWRLVGVKRIVIHDHSPGDRPAIGGFRAAVKRILHRTRVLAATHYVAVSPYIAQRLRDNIRVPDDRCLTVTNGIAPFECDQSRRHEVRQRLGVDEGAVLIVLVSRATRYKNLDFALRSVAAVLSDNDIGEKVYAVHCGDGPDLNQFEALAEELGIASRFRFLGRRDDIRAILCAADIAFHPSRGEAMSLAVLEFMSAGLAVLTSDLPSVSTAIEPGRTGLTYAQGDQAAAAVALKTLIQGPELRASLGAAAAREVHRSYTRDAMDDLFRERVVPLLQVGSASHTP